MHHPFTSPDPRDLERLESDPGAVRARAYDVVLNGTELGGGSIRIHDAGDPAAGLRPARHRRGGGARRASASCSTRCGYGAPPHGGIALGLDRMVMLMAGRELVARRDRLPQDRLGDRPDDRRRRRTVDERSSRELGDRGRAKSRGSDRASTLAWHAARHRPAPPRAARRRSGSGEGCARRGAADLAGAWLRGRSRLRRLDAARCSTCTARGSAAAARRRRRAGRCSRSPEGEAAKTVDGRRARSGAALAAAGGKRDSRAGRLRRRQRRRPRRLRRRRLPARRRASSSCRPRCWPRSTPRSAARPAIDLPEAKNAVGAFHHPASRSSATPACLATLPRRRAALRAGRGDQDGRAPRPRSASTASSATSTGCSPATSRRWRRWSPPRGARQGRGGRARSRASSGERAAAQLRPHPRPRARSRRRATAGLAARRRGGLRHAASRSGSRAAPRRRSGVRGAACARLLGRLGLPPLPALDAPRRCWRAIGRDKKAREAGLAWVLPSARAGARSARSAGRGRRRAAARREPRLREPDRLL